MLLLSHYLIIDIIKPVVTSKLHISPKNKIEIPVEIIQASGLDTGVLLRKEKHVSNNLEDADKIRTIKRREQKQKM